MSQRAEYDCVIIGGGPAGISCALELIEHKRSYVLLDRGEQLGGQLELIHNTIRDVASGFFENGKTLREAMLKLAERRNLDYRVRHEVTQLDAAKKVVHVHEQEFHGRTIVVATGASMRKLQATAAERFAADLVYQTEDSEQVLYGRNVAVVGGGDSALMEAMTLAEHCPKVFLIHRSATFNARDDVIADVRNDPRIEILPYSTVVELHGDTSLAALTIQASDGGGKRSIAVDRVVVKIGYEPHSELLSGQVDIDTRGFVRTNIHCETSASGVYAVGDNAHPGHLRIAISMGHGVTAANHIHRRLKNGEM